MRTPDHTGDRRRRAPRRASGGAGDGAAGEQPLEVGRLVVERAELGRGRPLTVTTVRSPCAARRTAAASSARSARTDCDVTAKPWRARATVGDERQALRGDRMHVVLAAAYSSYDSSRRELGVAGGQRQGPSVDATTPAPTAAPAGTPWRSA